jgi:hypothetical protein
VPSALLPVQSYPASSPTASRGTAVAVAVGQQYVPVTMVDHQAGLAKNPGFKKKTSPVGFFRILGFFGFFWRFFWVFNVFFQKREFLGFFSFKNTFR